MPALGCKRLTELFRSMAYDASPGTVFDKNDALDLINAAISYYVVKCSEHMKQLFERSYDITYTSGTELYRWTSFVRRVVLTERTDLDPDLQIPYIERQDRHGYLGVSASDREVWYRLGTRIGVVPTQTSGTLRVWYQAAPPPLHYGTCNAAGTTTALTMASTATLGTVMRVADAYAEMPVLLSSGTGGFLQTSVITANTAANPPVCTLAPALATAPDTTTVYELCPPLPEEFHIMIPMKAALIGKGMKDDPISPLGVMEKDFMQTFLNYISKPQEQTRNQVTRIPWE